MSHYPSVLEHHGGPAVNGLPGQARTTGCSATASIGCAGPWSQVLTPPSNTIDFTSTTLSQGASLSHTETQTRSLSHSHYPNNSYANRRKSPDGVRLPYPMQGERTPDYPLTTQVPQQSPRQQSLQGYGTAEHHAFPGKPELREGRMSTSSLENACSSDSVFTDTILTPPSGMPGSSGQYTATLHRPPAGTAVYQESQVPVSPLSTKMTYSHVIEDSGHDGSHHGHSSSTSWSNGHMPASDHDLTPSGHTRSLPAQSHQVCRVSSPPTLSQPYYSQGPSSYTSYTTPASPSALQFVAYNLDRMHQFEGNMSPLQHNRQRTQPLREWLYKNCQNPYPSKGDRDYLASQTAMSGDQVAMWFANTRRRIKKIGMAAWSNGKLRDGDFHAKSLPSSCSSSRKNR